MSTDVLRSVLTKLQTMSEHMRLQCSHPPCQHAQGIDLAISVIEHEIEETAA